MRTALALLVVVVSSPLVLFAGACGDDPASVAPEDAAADAADDVDHSAHLDAGPADPEPELRCSEDELSRPCDDADGLGGDCRDRAVVEIEFNMTAAPDQYTNHCLTVSPGAMVVFSGSFFQHPLEPAGGDTPSPIPAFWPKKVDEDAPAGTSGRPEVRVQLADPGTYGYQCTYHPIQMYGVIRVAE